MRVNSKLRSLSRGGHCALGLVVAFVNGEKSDRFDSAGAHGRGRWLWRAGAAAITTASARYWGVTRTVGFECIVIFFGVNPFGTDPPLLQG